jgi:hypothetical protein
LRIFLLAEKLLYSRVDSLLALAFRPEFFTGFDERVNYFQTDHLCLMLAGILFLACLTLQAHLVLEETLI